MQRREQGECRRVKAIEIGEVACLVDAIDVGFLRSEGKVCLNLAADRAKQGWVNQVWDDAVFVPVEE